MSEYDTDVLLWSEHQAGLLRRRAAGELVNDAELDWHNIAEEIESVGKTATRELASRVSTILVHLMKLAASPATEPRTGWRKTIREQRAEIDLLLEDAPSLRQTVGDVISKRLDKAKEQVRAALADYGEQPRVDIGSLTFAENQVLGDWFPEESS
ncbi:MAG: DUF29 domain-containing protein [Rhodopila sp.]